MSGRSAWGSADRACPSLPHRIGLPLTGRRASPPGASPCSLLLVGTVHLDPRGPDKLRELLEQLEPTWITVELSRYGLEYRRRVGRRHLEALADALATGGGSAPPSDRVLALQRLLQLPYEYVECARRAEALGVPVDPIDLSRHSYSKLRVLSEVLSPNNLEQLAADREFRLSRAAMEQQLLARRYFHDANLFVYHFRGPEKAELSERGAAMAGALARRIKRAGGGPVVHVGGWHHLLRPGEGGLSTLALHLRRLGVRYDRMLLGDRLPPMWRGHDDEGPPAG